jgi:hypothetical protein
MTPTKFDDLLQEWLQSEVPPHWRAPASVLPGALEQLERTRQRPRWLATVVRQQRGFAIGMRAMPAFRAAVLAVQIALIVALALTVVGAAALLLREPDASLTRNGPILYVFAANDPSGRVITHLVEPDGSGDRLLSDSASCGRVSSDGLRLIHWDTVGYTSEGYAIEGLEIIDFDGAREPVQFSGLSRPEQLAWSPDGQMIAFTQDDDARPAVMSSDGVWVSNTGIWVAALADSTSLRLAPESILPREPRWSPDGSWIGFVAEDGLYIARPDVSDIRVVAAHAGIGSFSWSPDGKRLAYNRPPVTGNPPDIFIVELDGSGEIQLTQSTDSEHSPDWSPDGSTIAFIVAPPLQPTAREVVAGALGDRLGLVGAVGGAVSYLDGLENVWDFAWSPDSKLIAASANAGLWTAPVAGDAGSPVAVLRTPRPMCVLWLPEAGKGEPAPP